MGEYTRVTMVMMIRRRLERTEVIDCFSCELNSSRMPRNAMVAMLSNVGTSA
jgi:hypothetical protein